MHVLLLIDSKPLQTVWSSHDPSGLCLNFLIRFLSFLQHPSKDPGACSSVIAIQPELPDQLAFIFAASIKKHWRPSRGVAGPNVSGGALTLGMPVR